MSCYMTTPLLWTYYQVRGQRLETLCQDRLRSLQSDISCFHDIIGPQRERPYRVCACVRVCKIGFGTRCSLCGAFLSQL